MVGEAAVLRQSMLEFLVWKALETGRDSQRPSATSGNVCSSDSLSRHTPAKLWLKQQQGADGRDGTPCRPPSVQRAKDLIHYGGLFSERLICL